MKTFVIGSVFWIIPWGSLSLALLVLGYSKTSAVLAITSFLGWWLILGLCQTAKGSR